MFSISTCIRLRHRAVTISCSIAVLICWAAMAAGQADQGAITGTVLDPAAQIFSELLAKDADNSLYAEILAHSCNLTPDAIPA